MSIYFTKLPDRAFISVSGEARIDFLEGLITNSISNIQDNQLIYSCLLNAQGKFLFDFFIRAESDTLILECEGGERAISLLQKLKLYKLRSKVTLEMQDNVDVYAVWGGNNSYKDPRHTDMGYRSYTKPNGEEKPFEAWDTHRIKLGVPDGSRDLTVEKSTLLDFNIDKLNGIDFKKGCYVGQEVTARMHYRGLAKKHLQIIEWDTLPNLGEDIIIDGKMIGEMRSSQGNIGLALIKDDALEQHLPFTVIPSNAEGSL
jgi:hypothetical protein